MCVCVCVRACVRACVRVCFFKGDSVSRVFNVAENDDDTNVPTSVNGAEY